MNDKEAAKAAAAELLDVFAGDQVNLDRVNCLTRYSKELRAKIGAMNLTIESAERQIKKLQEANAAQQVEIGKLTEACESFTRSGQRIKELEAKVDELLSTPPKLARANLFDLHQASDESRSAAIWEAGVDLPPQRPGGFRPLLLGEATRVGDLAVYSGSEWVDAPTGIHFGDLLGPAAPRRVVRKMLTRPRDRDFAVVFTYVSQFIERRRTELSAMQMHWRLEPGERPTAKHDEQAAVCRCCGAWEVMVPDVANGGYESRGLVFHREGCWVLRWDRVLGYLQDALNTWLSLHPQPEAQSIVSKLWARHHTYDQAALKKLQQHCLDELEEAREEVLAEAAEEIADEIRDASFLTLPADHPLFAPLQELFPGVDVQRISLMAQKDKEDE